MTTKKWLRIIYTIYAAGIVLLLVLPREIFPDFYRPVFMAGISTVGILLVAAIGWIFKTSDPAKQKLVENSQMAAAFTLITNSLGGLGMYKLYLIGIPYDKMLHFALPAVITVLVANFIMQWYHRSRHLALSFTVWAVVIGGVVWEGSEVLMDKLFNTQTAGVYGTDFERDTTLDVFADIAGVIVGSVLFMYAGVRGRMRNQRRLFYAG